MSPESKQREYERRLPYREAEVAQARYEKAEAELAEVKQERRELSTAIPYLDEVWNVTTGCGDAMASPGCLNCYARRMTARNLWGYDFAPTFHADRLEQPLHWRKPRVVGVSFMGDLFHKAITDGQVDRVFEVIHMCRQHTFMLLTKRPERMSQMLSFGTPLPNLWLGVTVCNQAEADRNLPILQDTPAAVRWVSIEPMLSEVRIPPGFNGPRLMGDGREYHYARPFLDWVVCGPETGPGKRPFDPQWAADVREQCIAAGVPYFDKRESHKHWRELPVVKP